MPVYTFRLQDGCGGIDDETGVELRDRKAATRYARDVVHELMKSRELETRSWRLDVWENGDSCICQIPFASVDPTLDGLPAKMRGMVEALADKKRSLSDAVAAVQATVEEARALVARSRGKPYLASRLGKPTIR